MSEEFNHRGLVTRSEHDKALSEKDAVIRRLEEGKGVLEESNSIQTALIRGLTACLENRNKMVVSLEAELASVTQERDIEIKRRVEAEKENECLREQNTMMNDDSVRLENENKKLRDEISTDEIHNGQDLERITSLEDQIAEKEGIIRSVTYERDVEIKRRVEAETKCHRLEAELEQSKKNLKAKELIISPAEDRLQEMVKSLEAELKKQCKTCRQSVAQCEDCETRLEAELADEKKAFDDLKIYSDAMEKELRGKLNDHADCTKRLRQEIASLYALLTECREALEELLPYVKHHSESGANLILDRAEALLTRLKEKGE